MSLLQKVADNVEAVRNRIAIAASRSGRDASQVKLVAVSKYAAAGDGMIEALLAAGCVELGESRPQLLVEKAEYYADQTVQPVWHLIGSLQRNKVRRILPFAALIHSVDSVRLAEAIDRIVGEEIQAGSRADAKPVRCLLEIAISGDAGKQGFSPESVPEILDEIGMLKHLAVDGLMCMSGLESDADEARREFEFVRKIAERCRDRGTPSNVSMKELSMGMSDDFEIAVEEGATLVRIGSALY